MRVVVVIVVHLQRADAKETARERGWVLELHRLGVVDALHAGENDPKEHRAQRVSQRLDLRGVDRHGGGKERKPCTRRGPEKTNINANDPR